MWPFTQHNEDHTPPGTTTSGAGGQPFASSIEADLSHYQTWGQCQDAYGVYASPRDRRIAELKREGRL